MISNIFRRTYKKRKISSNEVTKKLKELPTNELDGKYLFHSTLFGYFKSILKDEFLYSSSKTKIVRMANSKKNKIFMNILFSPLKLKILRNDIILVFDTEELLKHYKIHYSDYSQFGKFYKNTSKYIQTMKNIPELVKRAKTLKTRRLKNLTNYYSYYIHLPEIVIHTEEIPLKFLNLVIILEEDYNKIDKTLITSIKTKYPNIKFYTKNKSLNIEEVHNIINN